MRDAESASEARDKMKERAMNEVKTVPEDQDGPWDTGELGKEEKYVACAPEGLKEEIDAALALQMISLRLQKDLINELKLIANYRGIGYQPLIRDVLGRFARVEMMHIANELQEQQKAREQLEGHNAELKVRMA
jgi:hypothetical protein